MKIGLVSPAPGESLHGNGVTARRWSDILADLGHDVRVRTAYKGESVDALVALHARRSADAIRAFADAHPHAPLVIALTGTDLYPDLETSGVDPDVLAQASRLVVLQRLGLDQLPPELRPRGRVIVQSVPPIAPEPPRTDCFEVAFLAHIRPVKDPLRLAAAVRLLPAGSRLLVTHVGEARDDVLAAEARAESERNPRYHWLGPLPRPEALRTLARARMLALTSHHEGGANVVSEALAAGVPVVSSRIPGSVGLLGEDYPGYFLPGDTDRLASLLDDLEHDRDGRYTALRDHCAGLRDLVDPARERGAWADLLSEIHGSEAP